MLFRSVFVIPKLCSRSTSCSFRMRTTHIWAGPSCSEPIGVTALVKHDLIVRIPVHTSSVPYALTLHPGAAIVCDTTIQYSSDALNHDTVQVAARDEPPTRAHARSRTLYGPDGRPHPGTADLVDVGQASLRVRRSLPRPGQSAANLRARRLTVGA